MRIALAKQMTAYLVAACMAQPAFAAVTDISNTPLGAAAGMGSLPNLLFILDDSGSMARDFNPDYVSDNVSVPPTTNCMAVTGGGNALNCQKGDPPFEAGGANGFNGSGYDPNFTYLPGLSSTGAPLIAPPLTPAALKPDAYLGGTDVDITNNSTDKRYGNANNPNCNPLLSPPCKRNGADNAGTVLPAGLLDPTGNPLAAGQFPYRANPSSASASTIVSFGLPEMMSIGSFTRKGASVTATTITAHGLSKDDRVFVTSGAGGLNVTCAIVTTASTVADPNSSATLSTFTYSTATSGNIAATNGSYRKCGPADPPLSGFTISGNTVTVKVSTGHFVVSGDIASFVVPTRPSMNANNRTITTIDSTTFTYTTTGAPDTWATLTAGFGVRTGLYNQASNVTGPPAAYSITPIEHCADVNLTNCVQVIPPAVPPASHPFPAYVRFCRTQAEALAPGAVTAIATTPPTPRCQLKYVNVGTLTKYTFARYGWFNRDTIKDPAVGGTNSYVNRPNRSDCAAPTCTYAQEIQNYATWFTYYSNRMKMMKTAAGRSFLPFISNPTATPAKPDRLRVGLITINPGSPVDPDKYLRIDNYNVAHAAAWYKKFYDITPGGGTPLRVALSRAGWIFAGKLGTGLTDGIPAADDPMQASCQKNYAFLTTDGFWNQGPGYTLGGTASANEIGNHDNVNNSTAAPYAAPDFFVSRASGTFDGAVSGATAGGTPGGSGTLADIALYYYKTDLRGAATGPTGPATSPSTTPPDGDVAKNNVSAKPGSVDFAVHQRMNTYTIGLADGLMRYQANYADPTTTTGDFANIKSALPAAGNCFWSTGTCNWPVPQADNQSALDDLWHAAVNGRGLYFSAVNPALLATGLSGALNSLDIAVASAAAAATSSPQVSQANTKAFSTTYQTSTWSGEIYAQLIDPQTGQVITTGPNNGKIWEGHKKLLTRVPPPPAPPSNTRVLKTFDVGPPANPSKLKDFAWALLSVDEQSYFKNHCTLGSWAQCGTLTPAQRLVANNGSALVDFLRGMATLEGTVFRDRAQQDPATGALVQTILGDIINSQPVGVAAPFFRYEDDPAPQGDYKTFKNTPRQAAVLVGANDGFLHAFDQNTGDELWAYAPRFLLPSMYQLADSGYPGQHRFFVDGTPEVADVFDTGTATWKTIVVGGMNSGGRGFYALDITDPANPKGLWEFCATSLPTVPATPPACLHDPAAASRSDPDLGFSYGNPVIGRRAMDNKWVVVVTSGLNNVPPPAPGIGTGDGQGHFYVLDAITGAILNKIGTGAGDTITPSGLMKIGAYYPAGLTDPTFTHVYGGDQQGNLWRLNVSKEPAAIATMPVYPAVPLPVLDGGSPPFVRRLAKLKDASGRVQPITARPAGTHVGNIHIYYVGTGRYIGNSDLTDPGAGGIAWQQTIYGIRDRLSKNDAALTEEPLFVAPASFRDGTAAGMVVKQTLTQSGANRTISKNTVDWTKQDGFFVDLNPLDNSPGERVFIDVRLVQGTLIVTSNIPAAGGGCVPGGQSYQYGLDYKTGGYVGNNAAVSAGQFINEFLVGAAIIQTADGSIKALNKSITGRNLTTDVSIEKSFLGKRFSYRER